MSIASYKNILFVDYENAGKVDLSAIPADVFVPFFFGASQKSVATDFALAMLYAHFGRKVSEADLHALVDRMIEDKKLSETDGALGYHL